MKPKHFWWLIDAEDRQRNPGRLSKADREGIMEAMRGNPKGDFW